MRKSSILAAMIAATAFAAASLLALPAEAQKAKSRAPQVVAKEYPWCARYGWTTSNCGFVTFQQCLDTIRGVGGFCEPNPRYNPPQQRRR